MNAEVPQTSGSRRRYLWLLSVFLLGILVGWLLAPRCKSCGDSSSSAAGGGAKLSGDASGGERSSGPLGEGRGDKPLGPDSGTNPPGPDAVGKKLAYTDRPSPSAQQDLERMPGSGPDAQGVPDSPLGQILKASDFRYDRTGLPRYAQAVSTTGSTLDRVVGSKEYHSTVAILTSSRFEDVVDWYKAQLPAGWTAQTVGDVGALAQSVSIGNILKTLTAATQQNGGASGNAAGSAAASGAASGATPANAVSVAMFSPPPDSQGEPSILIQRAGATVQITMSKNGTDP